MRVTAPTSTADLPLAPEPDAQMDPRLAAWERTMGPVIILAALVPIVVAFAPRTHDDPFVFINIGSWLIFLVDLLVHLRLQRGYLRTGLGRFDLVIVVLTFPWYLIPGFGNAAVLGLARLGRILRLVLAGGTTGVLRRLAARVGKAGLYSLGLIIVCSEVVYRVEPPSSGFRTQVDAIWWGFVTFTTVGYGDLVPETRQGRFVSVILMIGGVALIGLLAGSLAEFLTENDAAQDDDDDDDDDDDGDADGDEAELEADVASPVEQAMLDELRALRAEVADLRSVVSPPSS